jgi:hypothetical protein
MQNVENYPDLVTPTFSVQNESEKSISAEKKAFKVSLKTKQSVFI